jgi:hypothetical protein
LFRKSAKPVIAVKVIAEIISIKKSFMFCLVAESLFWERTFTELAGIRRLRHPTAVAVGAPAIGVTSSLCESRPRVTIVILSKAKDLC